MKISEMFRNEKLHSKKSEFFILFGSIEFTLISQNFGTFSEIFYFASNSKKFSNRLEKKIPLAPIAGIEEENRTAPNTKFPALWMRTKHVENLISFHLCAAEFSSLTNSRPKKQRLRREGN